MELSVKRFLILLILLLPALAGFAPAPQSEDGISMTIKPGIGGWYRYGQWIPVQILVESEDRTIDGRIQVRVTDVTTTAGNQPETTYRIPFTITEGGSKRVFLYVSVNNFERNIQVELLDSRENIVLSQRESIRQINYQDVLYAVVSESPTGVVDVSRRPISYGLSYQANWQPDDIPPKADALRSIDVLVFSDTDTGKLTADQQQAIYQWVISGGHLIVTGGPTWQRTTAGLLDLLPTEPSGTQTITDLTPLGTYLGQPGEELVSTTILTENTPKEGASVLLKIGDIPFIVRRFQGAGTVDFLAADTSIDPLRSWDGTDSLWYELVINARARPSWTYGLERFEEAGNAVSNVTGFNLPSVIQLTFFLLAYIGLIGPVNYLILNYVGRRELAWFSIPILIIIFTITAYYTGFSLRGDDVTVNQVNVVQIWPGEDTARVDGSIGILSPRRTTYDVTIEGGLSLRTLPDNKNTIGASQIDITEGLDYVAEDIPVDAAILTTFATSGYVDAPNLSGDATWVIGRRDYTATVTGKVTNDMGIDLKDAVILAYDTYYALGDLPAGETADFEISLTLDAPARLPLGNRVDPGRPVIYPDATQRQYNSGVACYINNGPNMIYESIMRNKEFSCYGGGDEEDRRIRRRALLVTSVSNEIDRNAGRDHRIYLFGWVEETPFLNVQVSNTDQIFDGTTLYVYQLPTTVTFRNPQFSIVPPGMTTWTLVENDMPNRFVGVNPDTSFLLPAGQAVAFRFTPMPGVPLQEVTRIELNVRWRYRNEGVTVSLWNWQTQEWQPLEFEEDYQEQFIINDMDFLGPENAVQVLVEADPDATSQSIERINVTLRGKSE